MEHFPGYFKLFILLHNANIIFQSGIPQKKMLKLTTMMMGPQGKVMTQTAKCKSHTVSPTHCCEYGNRGISIMPLYKCASPYPIMCYPWPTSVNLLLPRRCTVIFRLHMPSNYIASLFHFLMVIILYSFFYCYG